MPLFGGKSNKSQSSLLTSQDSHGVHSLARSPHQTPNDSPVHSPTYQYPPPPAQTFNEAPEPLGHSGYSNPDEAHPAHTITRSQSQRVGSGSNVYQRPSVNVTGPPSHDSTTIYEYPPPPSEPQQSMRPEKEQKRSKRERLFGIHPSSSKENTPSNQIPSKPIVRTSSVLRKPPQGQQDQPAPASQFPQVRNSTIEYSSQNQEGLESSNENLPISSADERDSPDHEQYYRQLEHKQLEYQKSQFDSPQSQISIHQSPQYHEDVPPQYNTQQGQYRAFHPPTPRENPNIYIDDQESQPERLSLHPFERPSSGQSFGPPSPILPIQNPADSRPSTAASINQSRYSTQSVPAQPQQSGMARSDPPSNQGQRQQINPQNNQSRQDPAQMETGHDSYVSRQGGAPQGPRSQMLQNEQGGRSTPPLTSRNREDSSGMDYQALLAKHEELQAKYSKVKKYYFEKDAQVTQLQNTVANQRLSMSKTSLDDNEYATRFNRLDGAINNLSFNIRKNWKGIPPWLGAFVNKDAHTIGTKEMTAVGRACITRWVVDEILDRYFHPSIEAGLSSQLKIIEKNIRRNAQNSAIQSDEHRDDLTTKLTNWRLTTLEGLQDSINGAQANEYRNALTQGLSEKLTASLQMNLTDPPPPGLDSGVGMIIELAIGIAANLPIESRDVCIEYFMPGTPIIDTYMKLEPGLPPLVNPALPTQPGEFNNLGDLGDGESMASGMSGEERERDRDPAAIEAEIRESAAKATQPPGQSRSDSVSGVSSKEKKKQSFLGGLVNKKPAPIGGEGARGQVQGGMGDREAPEKAEREREREKEREREREREGAIRFAAFVAVEVRGKAGGAGGVGNVLVKAPVYSYGQ